MAKSPPAFFGFSSKTKMIIVLFCKKIKKSRILLCYTKHMIDSGGVSGSGSDEAIRRLIEEFGGDSRAAKEAFDQYVEKRQAIRRESKHPIGPVQLSVQNVTKIYKLGRQRLTVLDDVSFDIHAGEFIAITGASGSGKSTLLQLIGGLDRPTHGMIEVDDVSIAKLSDRKLSRFRRQTIGFVFQFFYLQPFLRLGRNLEVPGMFARTKRRDRVERAHELVEKVGLETRWTHFPRELSGGQMQRAAIARALLNRPKILLADEPTGNLDSKNGAAIIELFETIRRKLGMTVILVTHDPDIAARADREIRLSDGRLV